MGNEGGSGRFFVGGIYHFLYVTCRVSFKCLFQVSLSKTGRITINLPINFTMKRESGQEITYESSVVTALSEKSVAVCGTPCTKDTLTSLVKNIFSENQHLVGWAILTTRTNEPYWRQECGVKNDKELSEREFPPPTIDTYDTIGHLRAYVATGQHLLLVVDHAELLLGVDQSYKDICSKFNYGLFFTEHVGWAELCDLVLWVTHNRPPPPQPPQPPHPPETSEILQKFKNSLHRPPTDTYNVFVAPATRWLAHFAVVLCVLSQMKAWLVWGQGKTSRKGGGVRTYARRRTRMVRAVSRSRVRGRATHITTVRQQRGGGVLSGILRWFTEATMGKISISKIVKTLLSFLVNLVPEIFKGVREFGSEYSAQHMPSIKRFVKRFVRVCNGIVNRIGGNAARAGKRIGITTARRVLRIGALRESFASLRKGFQTLFCLDTATARLAVGFAVAWMILWLSSYTLRMRIHPLSASTKSERNDAINVFKKYLHIVKSDQNVHSSSGTTKIVPLDDSCAARDIIPRHMAYLAEDLQQTIQQTTDLQATWAKDPHRALASRHAALRRICASSLSDAYLQECVKQISSGPNASWFRARKVLRYTRERVLIVIPQCDISTTWDLNRWNKITADANQQTQSVDRRHLFYITTASLLAKIPDIFADGSPSILPAHEIHYILPPSNAERHMYWTLFGTIEKQSLGTQMHYIDREVQLPLGLSIAVKSDARTATASATRQYEYMRTYRHKWTNPLVSITTSTKVAARTGQIDVRSPEEWLQQTRANIDEEWTQIVKECSPAKRSSNFKEQVSIRKEDIAARIEAYNTRVKALTKYIMTNTLEELKLTNEERLGILRANIVRLEQDIALAYNQSKILQG